MLNCKFCNSKNLIKKGFINNNQRYFCKDCKRHQKAGDKRMLYDEKTRKLAISMRIFASGLRQIAKNFKPF